MISLPSPPKVIKRKDNLAVFEIEALYPGYGATIGNSLRRVLFSSLEGAAITRVKIKGVQHEFSTIPGVKEDVINILLNLKQLRFKIFSQEPQEAFLSVKGEKKVKGSDFKLPTQVELVNKSAPVCTLTSGNVEIKIEILIEKGIGYEPIERRKKEKLEIGEVPIDAIYTPVRKVSFHVENMRVGERTDYDRLKIEIETDGTITPEAAMFQASEILINHFELINKATSEKREELKGKKTETKEDLTKIKVEDLKISARTSNALLENNIKTIGGILRKSEKDLLELAGMGETGAKEIKKALKKKGLELKK